MARLSRAAGDRAMPKRRQLRSFDLKKIEGFAALIGVDEVGRGALAGPVVAGAVLVTRVFLDHPPGRTPEEELLLQVQGMVAEYERAKILERSRRGKRHAARRGSVSVSPRISRNSRNLSSGLPTTGSGIRVWLCIGGCM